MIELTADDRAEIDRVHDEWRESWSGEPAGDSLAILDEMLARRFLAAGIERSMEACDREGEIYNDGPPRNLRADVVHIGRAACWGCAAAIRALLK